MLLATGGCASDRTTATGTKAPVPGAIAPQELLSASFTGIDAAPVHLKSGKFIGDTFTAEGVSRPEVRLVPELQIHGDLNNDNLPEALVLLTASSGGSGNYTYLALMGRRAGQLKNLDTVLLGDRVQIRNLTASGRNITAELVAHGPEDPACCPKTIVRQEWRLIEDRLISQSIVDVGPLSLRLLDGVTWELVSMSPANSRLSLDGISLQVNGQQLSGSGGCNRYQTSITHADAGALSLGPIAATQRACGDPRDATEIRFLSALQSTHQLGFSFGNLALSFASEQGTGRLLFRTYETHE